MILNNQHKTSSLHDAEIHTGQPLTNGLLTLFQGDISSLLWESGIQSGLISCRWEWVHVSVWELVWWGVKSHSFWPPCLLSSSLPWGDWAKPVSRGDFSGLLPDDSGTQEKDKDVIRQICFKILQGYHPNWKHKGKGGEVQGGQVVWKGRGKGGVMAVRECHWGGRRQKSKTSWVAQNAWLDCHRSSAQPPPPGWPREQLIKRCCLSSFYNISLPLLFLHIRQWKYC